MTVLDSARDADARTARRAWLAPVVLALVSPFVVVAVALLDHAAVTSRQGLERVRFGVPFAWLSQDQTSLSPRLPAVLSPSAPWENPTTVAAGAFIADTLVLCAILLAGLWVLRLISVRRAASSR